MSVVFICFSKNHESYDVPISNANVKCCAEMGITLNQSKLEELFENTILQNEQCPYC